MKLLAKLRVRLVLWTVALETVLLVVFAALLVFTFDRSQNQQIEETLRLSASQLNAVIDTQDGQYVVASADAALLQDQGIMAWIVTSGGVVAATVGRASNAYVPVTLPDIGQFSDTVLTDGTPIRLLVAPFQEDQSRLGILILGFSLRPSQTLLHQIILSLILAIPVVILLSSMGGLFLANRALKPVSSITTTARQISAADLSQRLNLQLPNDEIGQLATTLDAMLERLERAFQRERQLTSDVSHELRTPLGMLKTQLSLARSRPRDAETLLQMMNDMDGDVDRMVQLIEQMLMLARVENQGLTTFKAVNMAVLLTQVIERLDVLAEQKGIDLRLECQPDTDLNVVGDAELLRQVFTNLVENAIKYTGNDGRVLVHSACQHGQIIISVRDSGVGIAPEHIPHLFERFYRVDNARTRETGGFGLGLSLTQAVIRTHNGHILVESVVEQGTTLTVTLPLSQATAPV